MSPSQYQEQAQLRTELRVGSKTGWLADRAGPSSPRAGGSSGPIGGRSLLIENSITIQYTKLLVSMNCIQQHHCNTVIHFLLTLVEDYFFLFTSFRMFFFFLFCSQRVVCIVVIQSQHIWVTDDISSSVIIIVVIVIFFFQSNRLVHSNARYSLDRKRGNKADIF